MNKKSLLEKKYQLLCLLGLCDKSPLIGAEIHTSRFGLGTIISQTSQKTVLAFESGEHEFVCKNGEYFYEKPDKEVLITELRNINRQLDQMPDATKLIKDLTECWTWRDDVKEYYINTLVPGLMNRSIKGTPEEMDLIRNIQSMLSLKDWRNLPEYVRDIREGKTPSFIDSSSPDIETKIKRTCEEKFESNCLKSTLDVIEKLIEEELRDEEKRKAINLVNLLFDEDYLSSRNFYQTEFAKSINGDDFKEAQLSFLSSWFSTRSGNMPDSDQLSAIGALEQNVQVIARAGSGKTSTIINRARFLIEHCHVDPSSILMLAFNKKAAGEMSERMEAISSESSGTSISLPHIMTFHALAYSIVNPTEELIYNEDKDQTLNTFIQNIITENLQTEEFMMKVRDIMLSHFKGEWQHIVAGGYNLSKDEMLKYRRNLSYMSLRGDVVRSEEVRLLSNILFEYNIDYSYEQSFNLSDRSHKTFDFIIYPNRKARPIIIDCVDSIEKQNAIQDFNVQNLKKRSQYVRFGSDDFLKGEEYITERLCQLILQYDMPFERLSEDEIWERIKKRSIDKFTEAITGFIGRCRKECLNPKQLEAKANKYRTDNATEKMFIDVAIDIYYIYAERLVLNQKEDFDGLMQHAIALVENGHRTFGMRSKPGKLNNLKHILIDEYQDFSLLFDSFIEAIKEHCPSVYTFCVGDDWQAINGFAGSRVSYFKNFKTRFADTGIYQITTNYRSTQEIVSLGTSLMNPRSKIVANRDAHGIIKMGYYDEFPVAEIESPYGYNVRSAALLRLVYDALRQEKEVAVLSRIRDGIPESLYELQCELKQPIEQRHKFPKWQVSPTFKADMLDLFTVHKYKGKEKAVVIITDATMKHFPLVHPNWIFQRIFGDSIEKIVEDERRLFYVALTRAADELVILSEKGDTTEFLLEAKKYNLKHIKKLDWNDYQPAPAGLLNGRILVTNEDYYKPQPTIKIKSYLREAGFSYNGSNRSWSLLVDADEMKPDVVLKQKWVTNADCVIVSFMINESCVEQYLISNGTPKRIG